MENGYRLPGVCSNFLRTWLLCDTKFLLRQPYEGRHTAGKSERMNDMFIKASSFFVLGILYIGLFLGLAISGVGRTYPAGIYDWSQLFGALIVMVPPFLLGFLAGVSNNKSLIK
jgi:cytochrome c biogenesis protein CcdA